MRWTYDQQGAGSTVPLQSAALTRSFPGQVVYSHVPLSRSSIIWYRPQVGATLRPGRSPRARRKVIYGFGHPIRDCPGTGSAPESYPTLPYLSQNRGSICRGGHVLVTEFRGVALNSLFCADVLRPLDLAPLTDFTYKYHPAENRYRVCRSILDSEIL